MSKAVTTASGGPFFVGAIGLAAFLLSVGKLTLETRAFARWSGYVAMIGGACFLVVLLTIPGGTGDGSAFGYAVFPAMLSLVVWTVAAALAGREAATQPVVAPA